MASASQYASHDLGGITRKIYVMVLPDLSIADVNYTTVSASAGSATVATTVTLANDGAATSATTEGKVLLTLQLLREAVNADEKVLLFSQSLETLEVRSHVLQPEPEP